MAASVYYGLFALQHRGQESCGIAVTDTYGTVSYTHLDVYKRQEYDIAFTAIIEKPFVMTRYGKVQSLEDFKKLTYRDAAEAVKLFRSRDFFEILKYEDTRIKACLLYTSRCV